MAAMMIVFLGNGRLNVAAFIGVCPYWRESTLDVMGVARCQQGSRQIHVVLASTGCLVIHAWSVWWFFKHLLTKALMFECIFSHLGVHLSIAGDIYADRSLLPFLYHSSYIDPLNS